MQDSDTILNNIYKLLNITPDTKLEENLSPFNPLAFLKEEAQVTYLKQKSSRLKPYIGFRAVNPIHE